MLRADIKKGDMGAAEGLGVGGVAKYVKRVRSDKPESRKMQTAAHSQILPQLHPHMQIVWGCALCGHNMRRHLTALRVGFLIAPLKCMGYARSGVPPSDGRLFWERGQFQSH